MYSDGLLKLPIFTIQKNFKILLTVYSLSPFSYCIIFCLFYYRGISGGLQGNSFRFSLQTFDIQFVECVSVNNKFLRLFFSIFHTGYFLSKVTFLLISYAAGFSFSDVKHKIVEKTGKLYE